MICEEQNCQLTRQPTLDEVKKAVLGLNGDSACGADVFNGNLFHACWEIIGEDILEMAGFVKGRSIIEIVLLTQEIITDIRLRTKAGPNVVLKLDMMKAYDRLSWLFLTKVLRKMGFSERFIGMIFGIVSNNWYSILVNGQPHGFFKSSRGVKQGDPLSPTLFILAAEAMSRSLNALHRNLYFCGFGMPKWSPKINHLAYADDTIIFSSSDATSLRLIMDVLNSYEAASEVVNKIEGITGIGRQEFPFTYLGCPIFYSRRRMDYYEDLITKVKDKLQTWKGKLLSVGGRAVLINSVLQSMPIHLLSAVNPPAYVINRLHKIFARFFWSSSMEGKARHWASWDNLCLPKEEGGVGFRSLHDMSKALFCRLWWNFRTKPSLWSSFMCQKYCKKMNAIIVPWRYSSHVWRKMLECRDIVEHQIYWKIQMGSSLFWFDNWTGLGALYFLTPSEFIVDESIQNVNEVMIEGQWDVEKLRELLPDDLALHIINNIPCPAYSDELDKPIWSLDTRGQFSVKTAWQYLKRRKDPALAFSNMWIAGLPFKISFFMWKLWRGKLPLDSTLRRMGYFVPSKRWCCIRQNEETISHVFFRFYTATKVWSYFFNHAGISLEGLSLHQAIVKCWTLKVITRLKPIFLALPCIIVWELWKRRNSNKHGEPVSTNRVVFQVCTTIQALIKLRKPGISLCAI
ncbi:PREDICTED: uncharacterized protein LOC109229948 [Nicotiana attenuata]|uniref:uncharacterized protein LOC109229948 n=1 Tax=Nicotiana attenuata TaxID=49451 RepID=UPI000905BBCB|nr:PREDICTED: uncharacterized protein LOC109229948 [Nicotiana attenuata]